MKSGIYMIRHVESGRVYVGSAMDLAKRWRTHRQLLDGGRHHSVKLQRAWSKYGATGFEWEVIEHADPEALLQREQHWIDKLEAASPKYGLNINPTAGSNKGRKFGPYTPERSAKISAANRRRTLSAETRAKIGQANRGRRRPYRPVSPEVRARISAARKGKPLNWSAPALERLRARLRGPKSASWRAKARATWASMTPEQRRARVAPMLLARHGLLTNSYPQSYSGGLSKA